ncbi:malectin domain-containing carbohydrate-binding protein [Hymenobacter sp. YC55]|uniref:malectin domain-containing carbohydrate-binding protein n=1 Tax=Hymenobacter sp. YC55 TaxID=3034019 RepID=UPI0023F8AAB7|nr:malectin domain-containing carbohydrate-binding protein [Hymenobacter sp. YC55]MDF7813762.1 malectin domain-containing carbohydrate-binding protein [Hymenobacter sp. YC55]
MLYFTQVLLAAGFLLPPLTTQVQVDQSVPHAVWAVLPTAAQPAPRRPLLRPGPSPTPNASRPAEAVREVWAARYQLTAGQATDMTLDAAGNVVVTGTFYNGNASQYVTVKYAASGQQLWTAHYDEAAIGRAAKVVVDATGNVYVSGTGTNGPGGNRQDFITLKYSGNGTLLWSKRFDGGMRRRDYAADVAVDAAGNVYVTGTSDPGGTVESDFGELATVKYSPTGQPLWTNSLPADFSRFRQAVAIALDAAGDVVVTGFDGSSGYLTSKYAGANGQQLWQTRSAGRVPVDLAVDAAGDVVVTGSVSENGYVTCKYAGTSGQQVWQARDGNPGQVSALAVDGNRNVVVTGYSGAEYATRKYSPSGQLLWVARYAGPGTGLERATSVALDSAGNVYVTGTSTVATPTSTITNSLATVKYAAEDGQPLWVARHTRAVGVNAAGVKTVGVVVSPSGLVYVAGSSEGAYFAFQYAQTGGLPAGQPVVGPISATTDRGACSAQLAFAALAPGPPATLTYALPSGPITSPHVFPVGVSQVTATATSSAGTFQQTFPVTVTDTEAPTLTVPAEFVSFKAPADSCVVTRRLVSPTVTESCEQVTVVGVRSDSLALSAPFPVGQTALLWRATDQAGNLTQVRQYINVFEETLPIVRAQNVTVRLVNGQATVTAEQVNNGSSDNCGLAYMALSRAYFTAADLGPNPVTLFVWDRSRNLDSAQAVVTVLPAAPTSGPARYRLHAGGGPLTTALGLFAADEYAAGGAVFTTDQAIAGTPDEALYQTERYGSFTYNLPVPNGQYTVRLHFAEIYWNAAGQRVFDVAAEGSQVLSAYDIVRKVGAFTATTETFPVTVTDGLLTLTFAPGTRGVDLPKVSAIEVLDVVPAAVLRLKAGGDALSTSLGHFAADQFATGGSDFATDQPIAGTEDDALYQSERYGNFVYHLPVPNGTYTVKLHFAELYWNAAGQRVFDVAAEGTTVLSAYDIVRKVGPLTATTESFSVTVTDGVLSLAFASGVTGVDQAKVSAIEVLSNNAERPAASPLAAVAATKLPVYSAQVKLYPNPSADGRVTVELPAAFQGEMSYTLVSSLGTTLSQGQRTISAAGQPLTFDFSLQLAAEGLYYLHLRGAQGQAHVKLLRK